MMWLYRDKPLTNRISQPSTVWPIHNWRYPINNWGMICYTIFISPLIHGTMHSGSYDHGTRTPNQAGARDMWRLSRLGSHRRGSRVASTLVVMGDPQSPWTIYRFYRSNMFFVWMIWSFRKPPFFLWSKILYDLMLSVWFLNRTIHKGFLRVFRENRHNLAIPETGGRSSHVNIWMEAEPPISF